MTEGMRDNLEEAVTRLAGSSAEAGAVAERIRLLDWSGSVLGRPDDWPQALGSIVELALASRFPMFVAWGPELGFLYNDAYAEILGTKHPAALGARFRDVWIEIWDEIRPLVDRTLQGEAIWQENLPLVIRRHGFDEQAFFTFSYSPARDETGAVAGMICIVAETTGQVTAERGLRASEARLRLAVEAGRIGEWELDLATGTSVRAPRHDHIFGYSKPPERWGMESFLSHVVPEDRPQVEAAFRSTAQFGTGWNFECRIRRATDQDIRWIAVSSAPQRDMTGGVSKLFGVVQDITDQKRAEDRLRALNETLEAEVAERTAERDRTWRLSRDMLSVWDMKGTLRRASPAWASVLGLPPGEVEGKSGRDLRHPDDLERGIAAFAHLGKGETIADFEDRYRHADGSWRWISWTAAPEAGLVYAVGRDVTAEKAAREALLLHQNIVQSHRSPVCAFDTRHRLIAFNAAHSDEFFRIFGYRVRIGDDFPNLFPPEQAPIMRAMMDRALTGESYTVVEEFGDPDLAKPAWEVSYYPLRDDKGAIIGAFHHASDISHRLRAQADLAVTQDALRQAQKMEAVGQLTGGLAHDFNNLLTGIMGNLELLQLRIGQGRLDGIERFVTAAQAAGRRAATLTQRLLAFSRRQTLDPKPVDVNRLIAGMEEMLRRTVGPAIQIEVVGAIGLWTALIDAGQLENALLNLCINGRDAMPEGGRLTIETANKWIDERYARERDLPPGQYLSVCVTDTGTGMTPDTIARAFDPFFTTKPIGQGTGLGLSMIYGFARQSGGQVRIYSEMGEGTTVCVYLPRHQGTVEEETSEDDAPHSEGGHSETILVVDDEPTIRALLEEVLQDLGYDVIGAGDGAAALKVLESAARIDLLITDVGLPNGMNGRQVADAARSLRPGLQVLFITGYAENAAVGNGHMEPGMALLTKPFSMDEVARRVREMLDGSR